MPTTQHSPCSLSNTNQYKPFTHAWLKRPHLSPGLPPVPQVLQQHHHSNVPVLLLLMRVLNTLILIEMRILMFGPNLIYLLQTHTIAKKQCVAPKAVGVSGSGHTIAINEDTDKGDKVYQEPGQS